MLLAYIYDLQIYARSKSNNKSYTIRWSSELND